MHANSNENRLTHLLGVYNSDSDDEESEEKEVQENHGNNGAAEVADNIQTDWTQCYDRETGKPYFFNTSTNQHQWEIPEDYRLYLEWVRSNKFSETEQKWKVYEAEDSGAHYYVNEVTRIVSWEMPEGYRKHLESQKKEHLREKSTKPASKTQKKPLKKYPEHLMNHDSNEDKIELISSYSRSSDSEDEDVASKQTEIVKVSNDEKPPNQIPSEELLPYKMYTQDSNTDPQSVEKSSNQPSSILFSNETSVTLSELENTYSSSSKSGKSPENVIHSDTKSIPVAGEEIDVKLTMRKRRIEIPKIPQKTEPQPKVEVDQEIQSKAKAGLYANFQSGGLEFVDHGEKKEEIVEEKEAKKDLKDASTCTTEDDETEEKDLKELSSLIGAKVKFLSEGRPIVSGVQIMQIQLETLVAAFEAQQLTRFYVMNWLNSTAKSLLQLENDVAPNGWKCKWDRTNSRYYYQSLVTGKIQWDFPEPDVTCHGDEMEICTTPPHPGVADEEPEAKKLKQADGEGDDDSQDPRTPEPPVWNSSPEPPPPPSFDAAPPPPRITDKFHSELDSFYSDLASMETTPNPTEEPPAEVIPEVQKTTKPELPAQPAPVAVKVKKKKVKTSRTEMKEMSQLMAKWQKAQQDLKK